MAKQQKSKADRLAVADLVAYFEASEETTAEGRRESERDRDYVDGVQYTAEELAAFRKRRQPPIIINRIKRKVDFLRGYEMNQRVQPRVLPRTPMHEQDADAAEQALRYVTDEQRFSHKRSRAWDNLVVEGMAGYNITVEQEPNGEIEVTIDNVPWDRMFYDPHSSALDFSDARYVGMVRWEELSEARRQYPGKEDILDATVLEHSASTTYDDKPHYRTWGDKKRKRVRIAQIWLREGENWVFAEFTKAGILKSGDSPFQDADGESDCPLIFGSAYVTRDNVRYGLVREFIGPQDEINKRRSKSLHLLNVNSVIAEEGAVRDVEAARREIARPDGWLTISPGYTDKINVQSRLDMANGHMQLLQEAKNEIDLMGGNLSLMGNGIDGGQAASGRAIIASQQGGAMEIASLIDSLRDMDLRVYRAIWARIRQFWTGERWVRVTDDERNVKWVVMNADPMQMQMAAQYNPGFAEKISGVVNNIAELDCDIRIEDAPDGMSSQMDQFNALVQLKQVDANNELPFSAILEAMPNLRNKEQIMAKIEKAQAPQAQVAQQQQQLSFAKLQAEGQEKQASAQLKQAQAAQLAYGGGEQSGPTEDPRMVLDRHMMEMEKGRADIQNKDAQTGKIMQETALMPEKVINDRYTQIDMQSMNHAHEREMRQGDMQHEAYMQRSDQEHQYNSQAAQQDASQRQFDQKLKADAQARRQSAAGNQQRA